jgi:eukaryotic-like serine/threonine-protein kinase
MADDIPATLPMTLPGLGRDATREITERYEFLKELDRGGMGVVLRVLDRRLEVPVALKVLHHHLATDLGWAERFRGEARLVACLRHPGVPAVHDLGTLADGTPFYTMEEVPGRPLREVIARGDMPRRRLLEVILRVASTVAHAHELGIVHRDLSANNVLVGPRGDVRVIDWGLARRIGDRPDPMVPEVGTSPESGIRRWTRTGGTPGYAPPEQRSGGPADRRMDVYALGGLLGFVLQGAPPHLDADATMDEPELARLHLRCRSPDPDERPVDAAEVARALQDWLDGVARLERAEAAVAGAQAHAAAAEQLEAEASRLRDAAAEQLSALVTATEEAKAPAWEMEDEAARIDGDAERERVLFEQKLLLAIREEPSLDVAHELLARRWFDGLVEAERQGDSRQRARFDALIRSWRDGRYAAWADAPGTLALDTQPSGADVEVERYVERNRRLVPVPTGQAGCTPLVLSLPAGSYRLRIRGEGCHEVLLPVVLRRGEPWENRGAEGEVRPVWLPPLGALGADDCYVAAGWYERGGDAAASDALPRRRVYVGGFVIRRQPVRVREYVAFLDRLVEAGRVDEAMARVPREVDGVDTLGRSVLKLAGQSFEIAGDVTHDLWHPEWPVTLVDHGDARAFADEMSSGGPRESGWRLPHDHEWEKAARGADQRWFSFGGHLEAGWANIVSHADGPAPRRPEEHPIDESPYGVLGMTGNVRDWCANAYLRTGPEGHRIDPAEAAPEGALRVVRGGSWSSTAMMCRAATRFAAAPDQRLTSLGFRLVRSIGPD